MSIAWVIVYLIFGAWLWGIATRPEENFGSLIKFVIFLVVWPLVLVSAAAYGLFGDDKRSGRT